jgi:hypothetical protein
MPELRLSKLIPRIRAVVRIEGGSGWLRVAHTLREGFGGYFIDLRYPAEIVSMPWCGTMLVYVDDIMVYSTRITSNGSMVAFRIAEWLYVPEKE